MGTTDLATLADALDEMAQGTRDLAAEARAVHRHFAPEFAACFQDGQLIDQRRALRLQFFTSQREREARRLAKEAETLEQAAAVLRRLSA